MTHLFFVFLLLAILISESASQWSSNNPTVNNPISTAANIQGSPTIVGDGSGGAIITWKDFRNGVSYDIYAQRINNSGVVQWTADGVAISTETSSQDDPAIVSDGSGGAIITWRDIRNGTNYDIYSQRINSSGVVQWTAGGIAIAAVTGSQENPAIISDGSGGAIITWEDNRNNIYADIYAQRVDSSGVAQWTAGGIAVVETTYYQRFPDIVSDGSGGAIITWSDFRTNNNYDVYAQRIDSSGVAQWTKNGVLISINFYDEVNPKIASDGSGGAIITWEERRSPSWDIYARRINGSGVTQWTKAISTISNNQEIPAISGDGSGGAVITWQDYRNSVYDIYAQRVNGSGAALWTSGGLPISTATQNQNGPVIVSDGSGGVIIAWQDQRNYPNYDIYAQRVNSSGVVQWKANGAPISTATNNQAAPAIVSDGSGGAVITWGDNRNGNNDIYAQNIDKVGNLGPQTFTGVIVKDIPGDLGGKVRVRWNKSTADTSAANSQVMNYGLWRKIPSASFPHKGMVPTAPFAVADDSLNDYDFLMTIPAVQSSLYNVVVPTLEDSAAAGTHWTSFLVTAHTSNASAYYVSNADSGYSINNYGNNFGAGSSSTMLPLTKSALAESLGFVNISDIPHDQGGHVRLRWSRSPYEDSAADSQAVNYSIWRKIPADQALSQMKAMSTSSLLTTESLSVFDYLTTIPAVQIPYYNAVVSTLADSTAADISRFTFVVTAHTSNVNNYSVSPPGSGYSVDNLSPSGVTQVSAGVLSDSSVSIHWKKNSTDPDVRFYEVHRSITSGFTPDGSTRIGETSDTVLVDTSPMNGVVNYYRVVVVDIHDNKSVSSSQVSAALAVTQQITVNNKWNMVSIPITVTDYTKTILYPSATSSAYKYAGGYQAQPTLQNGTGYWLKFSGNQTVDLTGLLRNEDTINVVKNWNMIGSISEAIPTANITSIPGGMVTSQFYGYNGAYVASASIEPGKAYWVKVNQNGQLILSASTAQPKNRIRISTQAEVPPGAPDEDNVIQHSVLPKVYALGQNYPNPFNPSTLIKYDLPEQSKVVLKVYDLLGREVAALLDETQDAGYREIEWDASNVPSGVYFYRLTSNTFTDMKKMVLIK